jgi:hypothetical protein
MPLTGTIIEVSNAIYWCTARLSPISKPRHINSIFTVNTPISYIYLPLVLFEQANRIDWIIFCFILSLTEI